MNNSIQVTLSMMPVDTTVSKDSNSAIGIADRIMKSMYTQQSDDLLSQLEVINKTTTDMNEFNRVVITKRTTGVAARKLQSTWFMRHTSICHIKMVTIQ